MAENKTLFQLTSEMADLEDELILNGGELTEELALTLPQTSDALVAKVDSIGCLIRKFESSVDSIDAEIKRLQAKKKSLKNGKDRLKKLMFDAQMACGEKKLQCGSFTTYIQKNPPKFVLDVESVYDVPEEFLKYSEPEVKSKEALDAMKAGKKFTWCHSIQEDSLRIR